MFLASPQEIFATVIDGEMSTEPLSINLKLDADDGYSPVSLIKFSQCNAPLVFTGRELLVVAPGRNFNSLINPHQRCRYSDLPFARKDTLLYCRVQKWI